MEFLEFELFVEKADLKERLDGLREHAGIVLDEFFEGVFSIDKLEEGVVHDEIIKEDLLLLLLFFSFGVGIFEILVIGVVP